jgi:tetratricopeptide (TPR) repeat protein
MTGVRPAALPFLWVLAVAAGCTCGAGVKDGEAAHGVEPAPTRGAAPPSTQASHVRLPRSGKGRAYAEELRVLDAQISRHAEMAAKNPKDGLSLDLQAGLYLQRARITGSIEDYVHAEESAAAAEARSGPLLAFAATRASLHFALHRWEQTEAELLRYERQVERRPELAADIALRRARLAMQRGDDAAARAGFQNAIDLGARLDGLQAISIFYSKIGDFQAAEDAMRQAFSQYHGLWQEPRAWMNLQMALFDLERERFADALEHLDDADGEMPGWWLVDEHRAEILGKTGQMDEAMRICESVIERSGKPEYWDALAAIHAAAGRDGDARAACDHAAAGWKRWQERFPEAAKGHASRHAVVCGDGSAVASP